MSDRAGTDRAGTGEASAYERYGPFPPSSPHPGWWWAFVMGPLGSALVAAGLWFLSLDADPVVRLAVGSAIVAWGVLLLVPIAIVTTYAMAALWMRSQERAGRRVGWRVPWQELQHVGLRVRWTRRGLQFGPAEYDGPPLPLVTAGNVVHVVGIGIMLAGFLVGGLAHWTSTAPA